MHPLVPPCVLAGGSPCPEQHLSGWAKGGWVGGQGWDPPGLFQSPKLLSGSRQGMLLLVCEGFSKGLVHASSRA